MQEVEVKINAKDEFSKTLTALNTGLETAVTNVSRIGAGFETATDKIKEMMDRFESFSQGSGGVAGLSGSLVQEPVTAAVRITEMSNAGVDGASSAEDTGVMDGTASQVEARQAELEQRAQHNTALFALEQEHQHRTMELDKMTWDTKFKTASTAASTMANLMQNLYVATGSKNKAMFEVGKAFAIAETIINTRTAAMKAYQSLSGIPIIGPALGVAAAAAALAAGAAQVQEISSTQPGGGSISAGGTANPAYRGGSPSAYPIPQRLEAPDELLTQHITVNIHTLEGSEVNWQKVAEENIKPALENLKDRNISLDILTT